MERSKRQQCIFVNFNNLGIIRSHHTQALARELLQNEGKPANLFEIIIFSTTNISTGLIN